VIGQIGRKTIPLFLPRSTALNIFSNPEKLRYGMKNPVFTTTSSIPELVAIFLASVWI